MALDFSPNKIVEFLERRKEQTHKNENNVLATVIKNIRRDKRLTLEDMTSGICSKAYLCKFENNLISIDKSIAKLLCERVKIDYDAVMNIDEKYSLSHVIKCYLFNQNDQIVDIYNTLGNTDLFIANNELIKALYALVIKDEKKQEEHINALEKVKTTLTDDELEVFLICIIEHLIQTNEFIKAKCFLKVIPSDFFTIRENIQLMKEERFIVHANLNEFVEAQRAYSELNKEYERSYPMKRQFYDKVLFMETFSSFDTISEFKAMLQDYIPEEYKEYYWYSYCIVLIKNGDYKLCLKTINTNNLISPEFCGLYALCLCLDVKEALKYDLKEKKRIVLSRYVDQPFIKGFNIQIEALNTEKGKNIHKTFVKLIQYEMNGTKIDDIIDYLRDEALKIDDYKQHRMYSPYYAILLFGLLGSITHYKDAYTLVTNNRYFNIK